MSKNTHEWLEAEWRETERLKHRAWKLGIEIPSGSQWWDDDDEMNMEAGMGLEELELTRRYYLTEEGKARLKHLIQEAETRKEEARLDRLQKRVSLYAQIVTMIVSLGGVAMGIIAIVKNSNTRTGHDRLFSAPTKSWYWFAALPPPSAERLCLSGTD